MASTVAGGTAGASAIQTAASIPIVFNDKDDVESDHRVYNSMSASSIPAVMLLDTLLTLLCIQTQCQDILDD